MPVRVEFIKRGGAESRDVSVGEMGEEEERKEGWGKGRKQIRGAAVSLMKSEVVERRACSRRK